MTMTSLIVRFTARSLLLLIVCCLLVGQFGRWYVLADIFNVFQWELLVAGIASWVMVALQRPGRGKPLILVSAAAILVTVAVQMWSDRPTSFPLGVNAGRPLKIVSLNLWLENPRPRAAVNWILRQDADAVVLLETAGRSAEVPVSLARSYPFQVACHRRPGCTTMILLREKPLGSYPLAKGDANNRQALSATAVQIGPVGSPVTIVAVHLSHPYPFGLQPRELNWLGDAIDKFGSSRLILAGDFNAPLTTFALKRLILEQKLHPVGPQTGTWPANVRVSPLFQIDHILAGKDCAAVANQRGPYVGSDHSPVIAVVRC